MGARDGVSVGGETEGSNVGADEGDLVSGCLLGFTLFAVGIAPLVGTFVGVAVGAAVVGLGEGGQVVGDTTVFVDDNDGDWDGRLDGVAVGATDGVADGVWLGRTEGEDVLVGAWEGAGDFEGTAVGFRAADGAHVGL